MRRVRVGVSAITAVAVGCLVGCTPPPPGSPLGLLTPGPPPTAAVKERRTVTDLEVNICNGEAVHLTGELSEDTKVKDSKAEQHIKAHLTGYGNLGNEYKFDIDVESKWDTASMTMTFKNRYVLESKGSAPDQHVTVNIRSSPLSLKFEAECHGAPTP
jgi:hypothetical protein